MSKKCMYTLLFLMLVCTVGYAAGDIPVDSDSVESGTSSKRGESGLQLEGTPLEVGKPLPDVTLHDSGMAAVKLSSLFGKKVLLISVVPSVDTGVCAVQCVNLSALAGEHKDQVTCITISRDLPFAQNRFNTEKKIENLISLSDFAEGAFGKGTGLFIPANGLLTRAVIVADPEGVVRYYQVVPNPGHLPDLNKAFEEAKKLVKE